MKLRSTSIFSLSTAQFAPLSTPLPALKSGLLSYSQSTAIIKSVRRRTLISVSTVTSTTTRPISKDYTPQRTQPSFKNFEPSVMSADDAPSVPNAEYRQLGKSGLRVSVPILGAMSFGDKRWQEWVIEEDEVGHYPICGSHF